jgi:PIN domain nuclease of toxin-antitoxin system
MILAVSDTHSLIWYAWDDPRLSISAGAVFDSASSSSDQIAVSSISLVEIVYLTERRRIEPNTLEVVLELLDSKELLIEYHVDRSIMNSLAAINRAAIPDMPDRIIAATAFHLGVPLITRDGKIRASSIQTIW